MSASRSTFCPVCALLQLPAKADTIWGARFSLVSPPLCPGAGHPGDSRVRATCSFFPQVQGGGGRAGCWLTPLLLLPRPTRSQEAGPERSPACPPTSLTQWRSRPWRPCCVYTRTISWRCTLSAHRDWGLEVATAGDTGYMLHPHPGPAVPMVTSLSRCEVIAGAQP